MQNRAATVAAAEGKLRPVTPKTQIRCVETTKSERPEHFVDVLRPENRA